MKIIRPFLFILFCALACVACQSDSNNNVPIPLKGTKWKLIGFVDTQTGEMKILEPTDCEECYTLMFDTNATATVHSINITLKLDLSHLNPGEAELETILWCERYDKDGNDYCDSDTFRRSIILTKSYTTTDSELKLFVYGSNNSYLLFKPI